MKVHPVNLEIDTLAYVEVGRAKLALERLVGEGESCSFVPVWRVSKKRVKILWSDLESAVRTFSLDALLGNRIAASHRNLARKRIRSENINLCFWNEVFFALGVVEFRIEGKDKVEFYEIFVSFGVLWRS